jgi:bis(5'-adenosyl)-triphosphatase
VPHVHFHIIPRRLRDRFSDSRPDEIYVELDKQEGGMPRDLAVAPETDSRTDTRSAEPLRVDADEARKPRTLEDMEQEAKWLAAFFETEE